MFYLKYFKLDVNKQIWYDEQVFLKEENLHVKKFVDISNKET